MGTALALALLATLTGCDGDTPKPPGDAGQDYIATDGVLPPDLNHRDGSWPAEANVGAPCDQRQQGAGCKPGLTCLDVRGSSSSVPCDLTKGVFDGCGVCVLTGCTTEDIETAAKEDNCPTVTAGGKSVETVCTPISVVAQGDAGANQTITACLPTCVPSADSNPCKAIGHPGISCDPASILLNDSHEVCLYPACFKDGQCGNMNPVSPDAACHLTSGLCQTLGSTKGAIGAPCKAAADCGEYQNCFPEQTILGQQVAKDGYCTLVGCKYGGATAPHWQCPAGSGCFLMGSGKAVSLCLATGCDSAAAWDKDGCRDGSSEVEGQYDCHPLAKDGVCWIDLSNAPK